jgi:hypothetical protein
MVLARVLKRDSTDMIESLRRAIDGGPAAAVRPR